MKIEEYIWFNGTKEEALEVARSFYNEEIPWHCKQFANLPSSIRKNLFGAGGSGSFDVDFPYWRYSFIEYPNFLDMLRCLYHKYDLYLDKDNVLRVAPSSRWEPVIESFFKLIIGPVSKIFASFGILLFVYWLVRYILI